MCNPGDYVEVDVSDTGTGMSEKTLSKAVELFFTTKALGEGTGLGLSVIYGFAKQSHGHMRLFSKLGQGTTVKLYLPRAEQHAVELNVSSREVPRGQGETILIVEDEATVRLILSDGAQSASAVRHRICRAGGRSSGVSRLRHGHTPQAVLLGHASLQGAHHDRRTRLITIAAQPDRKQRGRPKLVRAFETDLK
jgi:hypothetical protein